MAPIEPWFQSPFFEQELRARQLSPELETQVRDYRENGFLVIEDAVDHQLLDGIREETQGLFLDDVADGLNSRVRVQDVWRTCPNVRQLACHPRFLELLTALYGRRAFPFQTLNFRYGSQQHGHRDSMFFNSLPADYMCGVWVALEDVSEDNGALFYYPGSHRLRHLSYDAVGLGYKQPRNAEAFDHDRARTAYEEFVMRWLEAEGLERLDFQCGKGAALIWAAGLVHGGGPIRRDGSTRWSQVTHYFFEDCLYTTPIYCNEWLGDHYLRLVHDVATGDVVQNSYYGLRVGGIEENQLRKLYLDLEDGRDVVRTIDNIALGRVEEYLHEVVAQQVAETREQLAIIQSSASYRLARTVTSPLRWLKRAARRS